MKQFRCMNCDARYIGCHSTCDAYQEARKERDMANQARIAEREIHAHEVKRAVWKRCRKIRRKIGGGV